jgi:hypothetical protein
MKTVLVALVVLAAPAQESLEKKVSELIARLSDDAIDAREQAVRGLADLGPPALPLLEKSISRLEGEVRGRVEEAIRSIRLREKLSQSLPPVKLITLDHRNRPAREALEEIGRQAGITSEFTGEIGKEAVTVSIQGATYFQAIDQVCAAHGKLLPQSAGRGGQFLVVPGPAAVPAGRTMTFTEGPVVPFPTCYVRQYRIRIESVALTKLNNFQGTESSGTLQMEVDWQPGVLPRSSPAFEITELQDNLGRSLLPEKKEDADSRGLTRFTPGGGETSTEETFEFKYPQADATRISLLRGHVVLTYPQEESTLVFTKPADSKGKSRELHGLTVTLTDYQVRGNEHVVTLTTSGKYVGPVDTAKKLAEFDLEAGRLPFSYEEIEAVTEGGGNLNSGGMSATSDEKTYTMTLTFSSEKPQTLKEIRIPCVLVHYEDDIKFELKDITFPK